MGNFSMSAVHAAQPRERRIVQLLREAQQRAKQKCLVLSELRRGAAAFSSIPPPSVN